MKKLPTLLAATAALSLLPSVSQAICVATGTIPRIFVQAAAPTNIGVRGNAVGAQLYNFTTTNPNIINAALNAESSHITVQIVGNAGVCPLPVGGFIAGGNVVNILVSP